MASGSGQNPQPEAWQLRTNGFNRFGNGDDVFTRGGRPSVARQARGNEKATKRKLVTGLSEIKQLALAERNEDSKPKTVKEYNDFLKGNDDEVTLENSCCWLCGKPFYEKPLGNPNRLGYLEVEHALPLKLGYMLLTIPGEITYDEKGEEKKTKQKYNTDEKSEIEMEILRSHRLCNNLKSNINFFKYTGDKGWQIKKDLVDTFEKRLTELQKDLNENEETTNTQTFRCDPNGTTYFGYFDELNDYSAKVNEAKLNAIVKRLNEKFKNFTVEQLAGKISEKVYLEVDEQQRNAYALSLIQYFNKNVEVTEAEETQTINDNYDIILRAKDSEAVAESATPHSKIYKPKFETIKEDPTLDSIIEEEVLISLIKERLKLELKIKENKTTTQIVTRKQKLEKIKRLKEILKSFDEIKTEIRKTMSKLEEEINIMRQKQNPNQNLIEILKKKEERLKLLENHTSSRSDVLPDNDNAQRASKSSAAQRLNQLPTDGSGAGTSTAAPAAASAEAAGEPDVDENNRKGKRKLNYHSDIRY